MTDESQTLPLGARLKIRHLYRNVLSSGAEQETNPGLLLAYGYAPDATSPGGGQDQSMGLYTSASLQKFLDVVATLKVPEVYRNALNRWKKETETAAQCICFSKEVNGRLFLGLGESSVLETWVNLHRIYGVPFIPGTGLKGLASAFANQCGLDDTVKGVLFGREGSRPEDFESGYLVFHDAWWEPRDNATQPLVREIITPHHQDYYAFEGGKPATDFDSPMPSPHLAVHGFFYFVVECPGGWAKTGAAVLQKALEELGAGAATRGGYGHFTSEPNGCTDANALPGT